MVFVHFLNNQKNILKQKANLSLLSQLIFLRKGILMINAYLCGYLWLQNNVDMYGIIKDRVYLLNVLVKDTTQKEMYLDWLLQIVL